METRCRKEKSAHSSCLGFLLSRSLLVNSTLLSGKFLNLVLEGLNLSGVNSIVLQSKPVRIEAALCKSTTSPLTKAASCVLATSLTRSPTVELVDPSLQARREQYAVAPW